MDVNITDDEELENEEQFFLNLQSLSPHTLNVTDGLERQTVVILDNERKTLSNNTGICPCSELTKIHNCFFSIPLLAI